MIKRISAVLSAFAVIASLTLFFCPTAIAASGSITLSGTTTIRAGDNITVTLSASGTNICGGQAKLNYDTSLLTYKSYSQSIASPWEVDVNDGIVMFVDGKLTSPINSKKAILKVTFQVKSTVNVGTKITVSLSGCELTEISASGDVTKASLTTGSYSATVSSPLSANAMLSSLKVANAVISPAFDSDVANYTAEVGFDVTKLDVTATAEKSTSKVTINSPELVAGGVTDVTVKVKAESGAVNTYTISVTRAQDPNYAANSDNKLYALIVEDYFISPAFDPTVTQYVVWLPYEAKMISVEATAVDEKATVKIVDSTRDLKVGDNSIRIVCTAEDGSQKMYTLNANRADCYPKAETNPADEPASSQESAADSSNALPIWLTLALCAVCAVSGFVASRLVPQKNPKVNDTQDENSDIE